MKKTLSILLVLVFLAAMLAGCSGGPKKRRIDAEFQIIYESSVTAQASAQYLKHELADRGFELEMCDVAEFSGELSSGKFIFVGETGLVEDVPVLSAAEDEKFSVTLHDAGLAIRGIDALSLHLAIERVTELWGSSEEYGLKKDKLYISTEVAEMLNAAELREAELLSVMTQNVLNNHYGYVDSPAVRMPRFKGLIELYQPDLLGLQEVGPSWYRYIQNNLGEEYEIIGETSDGLENYDSFRTPVLYKKERFELLDSGSFWLSDTPDVPSAFDDAKVMRVCSWAKLKDKKTGEELVFANTHADPFDSVVRKKQINMLTAFFEKYKNECAVYFTGDFNAELGDIYMNNVFPTSKTEQTVCTSEKNGTFHDFHVNGMEIDFVFHNPIYSRSIEYHICDELFDGEEVSENGGYISDHYAIITRFLPK